MRDQPHVETREPSPQLIVRHYAWQAHVGMAEPRAHARIRMRGTHEHQQMLRESPCDALQQFDIDLRLEVSDETDDLPGMRLDLRQAFMRFSAVGKWSSLVASIGPPRDVFAELPH